MATKYDKIDDKIDKLQEKLEAKMEAQEKENDKKFLTNRELAPWIKIFQAVIIALAVGLATAVLNLVLK